ncbi:MAG: D-arabinono-1,4-lactone oxidase, partial [Pseudomonadales bacterium]|nr:D-arabinono-1,4-lactone oxidase [Pseudomonadales bacterium]
KLPWPVEYRVVAGDDGWLSPTAGREVAAISVHQDARRDPAALFEAAEAVFRDFGGRPHWGKRHGLDGAALAQRYLRLPEFLALRSRLDPQDRFLTAWLRSRLGA